MKLEIFFDYKRTKTVTYVIIDEETSKCAIIDSVLDYDLSSGNTFTENADKIIKFIQINNLEVEWILETHVHADHLTAAQYLKSKLGGRVAIGENIKKVINYWKEIFEEDDMMEDCSHFDKVWKEDEEFFIGNLKVRVIFTPGHTPACVSYYVGGYLFTGDTLFSPLVGTARTDFPGGSSEDLFDSIQKIYELPDETKICVGHEYPKGDSQPIIISTIGEEKQNNVSINENTKKKDYALIMQLKQTNLKVPELILPSLYVNLLAGNVPKFIKIPINAISDKNFIVSNQKGGCSV